MNDIIGEIHRIRERQAAGRKLNAMSRAERKTFAKFLP